MLSLNILSNRGRTIRPKTLNQKSYVESIDKHTITFGIGPAGTGKTYLAMAKAVQALQSKNVNRIILTRPAVEAGERLGFLPGTLSEKIDPYLRPLYDALHDMLDPETIPKLLAANTIEVAPLAYMRGRTLNDAFIILDEAQNTSPEQMKMFLTRLGFGSKMVVTGDVTQVDLPTRHPQRPARSWRTSSTASRTSSFNRLTSHDVVRHRLVGHIVAAYDDFEARRRAGPRARRHRRGAQHPACGGAGHEHRGPQRVRRRVDVTALSRLARFVMDQMRVHPMAELCIKLVDEATIAELNEKWMEKEGPTDVLAFPMDELRPGLVNEEPEEGVLGDLVLCASVAGAAGRRGRPLHVRRAAAADGARHPAPAGLRPRRARGARGDVRPAGHAADSSGRTATGDAGHEHRSTSGCWSSPPSSTVVAGLFSSADAALSSFSKARAEEIAAEGGRRLRRGCW